MLFNCKVFTEQTQAARTQHEKSLVRAGFHKQGYNGLQAVCEFTLPSSMGNKEKSVLTQGRARATR